MSSAIQLERIRYWQGQLLSSGDLQKQMAVVAELRRQHNRAVHSAYGIAMGLTLGDISDSALPLSCGLAYDCSGRELVVPVGRAVPLPVPAITTPYLLLLAYDANLGDVSLTWRPQGAPVSTNGVAIARILPGTPDPQLDTTFRPVVARPMARPQLASGQTVPGDTAWETWEENEITVGVESVVDTSAAGFTTTPNYFAEAVSDNPTADFVPAWFTSIADPAPDSFTLRLFMRRITREAFDIVDPKTQVAETPPVGGAVSLESGNVFVQWDWVSRLLPVVSSASVVTKISGMTATLDNPLASFTGSEQVAFGNPPRIGVVTKVPTAAASLQVTVDTPANFQAGATVVKLVTNAHPTTVASIDDQGELELADQITLASGDQLGIAQTPSLVTNVTATTVTVQNPNVFNLNDIVVCVDGDIISSQITKISGASNEILTLTPVVNGLNGKQIASVQLGGTVQTVDTEPTAVKISVDQPKLFRAGDIVAKIVSSGAFSESVRVQAVQSTSKTLTLSKTIAGLGLQDQIGAADFRVRATVLGVAGTTVTVANASLFPVNSLVVGLDDSYTPTGSAHVTSSSGGTITLDAALDSLAAGDIIALCSFPVSVTVESIDSQGIIQVNPAGLIKAGDVVASIPAHPEIAIVAAASGSSVQLAAPIPGLTANDVLSIVTVSGTLDVTAGQQNNTVILEANNRVRVNDFLADIDGWREPGPARSIAFVVNAKGTDITLSAQLDGLMVHDNIGFASLVSGGSWMQLRLQSVPDDLTPGDEALLVGLDRLQGVTTSMFARVEWVIPTAKLVFLGLEGTPGTFAIRPEDLTASILFVRGSPLALVQNQNLYVSWLACQDPDPMPRPCTDPNTSDDPCGNNSQS